MDAFITLLRSAITGTNETADLADVDYEVLYSLSKSHDLAHIVYCELEKRDQLPEGEILTKFKHQNDRAVFRHARRMMAIAQIREMLEAAKIPFVLLKGAVLMDLYPEPWMRTSSDVDVLVHPEHLQDACHVFKNAGWIRSGESENEYSFMTPYHYHVELHDSIVEALYFSDAAHLFDDVWTYTYAKDTGSSELFLCDEMFYFYQIAHMAKHFKHGGCGVRTVLDVWLLNHGAEVRSSERNALLIKGGLHVFDDKIKALSEIWFSNAPNDSCSAAIADYIMNGGVYGTAEHAIAIKKANQESRFRYYCKRIFVPYGSMKYMFPVLKKFPPFLPFCWVIRWFRLLNPAKFKKAVHEIKTEKRVNVEDNSCIETLMKDLGLE